MNSKLNLSISYEEINPIDDNFSKILYKQSKELLIILEKSIKSPKKISELDSIYIYLIFLMIELFLKASVYEICRKDVKYIEYIRGNSHNLCKLVNPQNLKPYNLLQSNFTRQFYEYFIGNICSIDKIRGKIGCYTSLRYGESFIDSNKHYVPIEEIDVEELFNYAKQAIRG